MAEALEGAAKDASVRAVAFTSTGETFTAGNDVNDFLAGLGDDPPVLRFIEALVRSEKPIVAAVHGPAVGIGTTMLLLCDLVYASESALLHAPFVGLGLVPEAGSSLLLPRRVGYAVAAEMVLLGAPIEAARAKELTLVNDIVPASGLRAHALAKAAELAKKPPNALRISRALLRGDPEEIMRRVREEGAHFTACLAGPEAREAFSAFLERRPPDFTKRA
jgi:enoyl-CoA hydratase/carnithine racemase